jgi:thiol-disulfide isomerase/thioredoxin
MNKVDAKPSGNKNSSKKRMVFYYADWCGHCTNTKPEWQKLEDMYKNDDSVSIEKVNEESMSNQDKSSLKIEGYPTIILFVNGNAFPYEGARSASNFKSFIDKN